MSLLDQVKQTLGEAAANARDAGQNLGAQAAAQLAIKRLQMETSKKTRELGARVYEWHQSGTLVATGTVPREVSDLCHTLDDLNGQLKTEEEKLEAAKQEAEDAKRRILDARDARNSPSVTVYDSPAVGTSAPDSPAIPAAAAPAVTAPAVTAPAAVPVVAAPYVAPPVQTQILSGEDMPAPPPALAPQVNALGPSVPSLPNFPSIPAPGSNPDLPAPGIPVPGPDIPGGPGYPSPNPDVNPAPTMPGSPGTSPSEPTMPGQPV